MKPYCLVFDEIWLFVIKTVLKIVYKSNKIHDANICYQMIDFAMALLQSDSLVVTTMMVILLGIVPVMRHCTTELLLLLWDHI